MALRLSLLIAVLWSLSKPVAAYDAAMAADDECAEGAPCALSALQVGTMRTSDSEEPIPCDNSSACDSNRTCVFKPDRSWSQCVPLDDELRVE